MPTRSQRAKWRNNRHNGVDAAKSEALDIQLAHIRNDAQAAKIRAYEQAVASYQELFGQVSGLFETLQECKTMDDVNAVIEAAGVIGLFKSNGDMSDEQSTPHT